MPCRDSPARAKSTWRTSSSGRHRRKIRHMQYLIACILLLTGGAAGQARNEKELENLASQLMTLQHADKNTSQRTEGLTSAIIALADGGHQPSRWAVAALARELTKALAGRAISSAAANQIATNIIEVIRSSGTGTFVFRQSISSFRSALSGTGASSTSVRTAASRLSDVGNEVRGPQDTPLLPPR